MSISTLASLLIGFIAIIAAFILDGGNPAKLLQSTAALIVFGGICGAVGVSFPTDDLKRIPKIMKVAFKSKSRDLAGLIDYFREITIKTRKNGLLTIEEDISKVDDAFIKKGLQMVVDGVEPQTIRTILEEQANTISERHKSGIAIFDGAGGFAPTMGIIGTVIGLVQILSNMGDPASLAEKISTAFVATLYGISSANLIFLPIANKLKALNKKESKEFQLIIEAILSIQEGLNPSTLVEKLRSFLDNNENARVQVSNEKVES